MNGNSNCDYALAQMHVSHSPIFINQLTNNAVFIFLYVSRFPNLYEMVYTELASGIIFPEEGDSPY